MMCTCMVDVYMHGLLDNITIFSRASKLGDYATMVIVHTSSIKSMALSYNRPNRI